MFTASNNNIRYRTYISMVLYIVMVTLSLCCSFECYGQNTLQRMYEKMRTIREKNLKVLMNTKNGEDIISPVDSIKAREGNIPAMIRYGSWCVRNERTAQGIECLERASALGNDTAKCYLAEIYLSKDIETFFNPTLAIKIINTISISDVNYLKAKMFYWGYGCSRNYRKATELLTTISDDSFFYQLACYYLSKCYRYGRGTSCDLQKSIELMRIAEILPLESRNFEETESKQFLEIIFLNPLQKEIEIYKKNVRDDVRNSTPTFTLG